MISLPPPVVDPTSLRPSRTSSRESSGNNSRRSNRSHSRRSHSGGSRSRNRHRHSGGRHHSRHVCRTYFRHNERNFAAATSSMIAIVLLCTALVPDWIYMKGGECHIVNNKKGSLHHLSTSQFFYSGHFYESKSFSSPGDVIYHFSSNSYDVMVNCVTHSSVLLFKASIAFTLISIFFSFVAFLLDLIGPRHNMLKVLRRNAIFNILTVIMCVTINLFTYLITTTVEKLQTATRLHPGSKVVVTFDASLYLITAAGGISVLATACNCLRRHSFHSSSSSHSSSSMPSPSDNFYSDDTESLLPLPPSSLFENEMIPDADLPPPPAYTP